jgi:hypothetical protein
MPVDPLLLEAREEGRAMSLDEAVAYALVDPVDGSRGPRPVAVRP